MARIKAFYFHSQPGRIGELAQRILIVRNLFPKHQYDITLVFSSKAKDAKEVNQAVFDVATRGVNVEFIDSPDDYAKIIKKHTISADNVIDINDNPAELWRKYLFEFHKKKPEYRFELTVDEIHKGQTLRDKLSIPQDAKIITLHVRESDFLPGVQYQYHNYRNAHIGNYIYAIRYLIKMGYYVVRLGDKSMQTISCDSPQLIDAPHHPEYDGFFDIYFIASSEFYLGMPSGPSTVADGFQIPQLITNAPPEATMWAFEHDLYIFKKCYSHQVQRCLTYEEIITDQLVDYNRAHLFKDSGIELLENTSGDLLAATIEMQRRIDGTYDQTRLVNKINTHIKVIQKKAHLLRRNIEKGNRYPYIPFYSLYLCSAQISTEYIKRNPEFLGHTWPSIEWDSHLKLQGLPIEMEEFINVLS